MTRQPPQADPAAYRRRAPLRRGERLRRRAAWMYYVEEMTQSAVAEALGVGRVTVVRMLAEARALGEVRIALARGAADLAGLEIALARTLGVGEAIIAPLSAPDADPTAPIGAALGAVISELVADDMKIGLGWGRTLRQALDHLSERAAKAVTVVSLVGDAPADILAAHSNGIRSISVQTGITPVEELRALQPDYLLRNLRQLRLRMLEPS